MSLLFYVTGSDVTNTEMCVPHPPPPPRSINTAPSEDEHATVKPSQTHCLEPRDVAAVMWSTREARGPRPSPRQTLCLPLPPRPLASWQHAT